MAGRQPPPQPTSLGELQRKLANNEEWLRDFREALARNAALTGSISSILDDFRYRISALSDNVSSLYAKTHVVQQEQQNLKKLVGIIEATMQFHGRTTDFENTIRDGNLLYNLNEYLEKMNNLKEAIGFFSTHAAYQSQYNQMNQIFETGCEHLETEFGNFVKSRSIFVDPTKIFELQDEEYEIPDFRLTMLATIREPQKLQQMAGWLIANQPSRTQFLGYYVNCRSENLLRTQRLILESSGDAPRTATKTQIFKFAFKKAAEKIGDKSVELSDGASAPKDHAIATALFLLSATLALIQLETKVCASIFANVRVEADVLRRTIGTALQYAVNNLTKTADAFDGNFEALVPLARFLQRHTNEIAGLCANVAADGGDGAALFSRARTAVRQRGVRMVSEFVERLGCSGGGGRSFLPADGNVHHVTSMTLNFLRMLVENRQAVAYIYEETTAASGSSGANSSRLCLSKLFAQILSALGVNLKIKAATYSDNTLGALFMFNNLSYISLSCARDKALMSVLDASNGQLLSFYQSEIDDYLERYLQSWSKVTTILIDRRSTKLVYTNFNKEFDAIIETQRDYCLVDLSLAQNIRRRIKELVLKPYAEFSSRNSKDADLDVDRQQVKYDVESIELIIDQLFDVPY